MVYIKVNVFGFFLNTTRLLAHYYYVRSSLCNIRTKRETAKNTATKFNKKKLNCKQNAYIIQLCMKGIQNSILDE